MNQLTPTEQEQVNQAAHDHATKMSTAPDKETPDWISQDFKAGVTCALSELCPARMEKFAEWCYRNYEYTFEPLDASLEIKDRKYRRFWVDNEQREYTTRQLLELYFEHLKHKQDGNETNKT